MYYDDATGDIGYKATNYTLHGKNIVHLSDGSNNLHFFYDAQNKPAVVIFNGTAYAYLYNLQGDVIGLVDSNGTKMVSYTYDAWGKMLSKTGTLASTLGTLNPFRYRGYVYDEETELYYLQSRVYSPGCARFINADGIVGATGILLSHSVFSYCSNNPARRKDVGGSFFFDTIFDIVSLAFSVAEVAINPTDPMAWVGLAGDVVDLIPGVTGVGETVRAVNTGRKAANAADTIVDGLKITDKALEAAEAANDAVVDTYRALKKANKGKGLEVHHIVEKRFATVLGITDTNDMLSVALSKADHRKYTNLWRNKLPYGKTYTKEEIIKAAQEIYADNTKLLEAAMTTLGQ